MRSMRGGARLLGSAALLLVAQIVGACDEQGTAEKAGQQAGQKIDQAIEAAKESTDRLFQEAEKKADEATRSIREGTQQILEEAERRAGEAADAIDEPDEDEEDVQAAPDHHSTSANETPGTAGSGAR